MKQNTTHCPIIALGIINTVTHLGGLGLCAHWLPIIFSEFLVGIGFTTQYHQSPHSPPHQQYSKKMMKLTFHPTPTTRLMAMIFKPNPKPPKPTATRKPQQQAGSHHKPKKTTKKETAGISQTTTPREAVTFTVTWLSIYIMHCLGLLVFLTVRALISLGGSLNLGSCAVP